MCWVISLFDDCPKNCPAPSRNQAHNLFFAPRHAWLAPLRENSSLKLNIQNFTAVCSHHLKRGKKSNRIAINRNRESRFFVIVVQMVNRT
jgi:hypothetical protein